MRKPASRASIASLFNPILYPDHSRHLDITQEELGAISGISRQNANQCLKTLEKEGLLRLEYGGVTVVDLEKTARVRRVGEELLSPFLIGREHDGEPAVRRVVADGLADFVADLVPFLKPPGRAGPWER